MSVERPPNAVLERPASARYVLDVVNETGVRFIGLWFSDVSGRLKSVSITDQQLESVLDSGSAFDGATMLGATRHEESDIVLHPDPSTFAILPWRSGSEVARMYCDLRSADGSPCDFDPRSTLKQVLERAAEHGLSFYVGCEVECYYFRPGLEPAKSLLDHDSYFDATPSDVCSDLRRETVGALEQLGIAVESTHHEVGPGQYEVKLQYSDPLAMADALMTYRQTARQLAMRSGLTCTFMPKPLAGANGSGLHLTISVLQQGADALIDAEAPGGLSRLAEHFVAGLLAHAPAISLATNPSVNSYKRLSPGFEAPTSCTWARSNWEDLVRVPAVATDHGGTTYVEYRAPDPSCNPYLAFAAVLSAGLDGILGERTPPPLRTAGQPLAQAGPPLPRTLGEAIAYAEHSSVLANALGARLLASMLENARADWAAYHAQVTPWELARYYRGT